MTGGHQLVLAMYLEVVAVTDEWDLCTSMDLQRLVGELRVLNGREKSPRSAR